MNPPDPAAASPGVDPWTNVVKAAYCSHENRTGGNDYHECCACGLMWDYRRETPDRRVIQELLRVGAAARQQHTAQLEFQVAEKARILIERAQKHDELTQARAEVASLTQQLTEKDATIQNLRADVDLVRAIDPSQSPVGYYGAAIELCADELRVLAPEKLPERRDKIIAILRHAAVEYDRSAQQLTEARQENERLKHVHGQPWQGQDAPMELARRVLEAEQARAALQQQIETLNKRVDHWRGWAHMVYSAPDGSDGEMQQAVAEAHDVDCNALQDQLTEAQIALDEIGAPRADGMGELTITGRCWALSQRWAEEQANLQTQIATLREALRRVRAHTAWQRPADGSVEALLSGLLQSIERITDQALAAPRTGEQP